MRSRKDKATNRVLRGSDPLHFDDALIDLQGGIQLYVDKLKLKNNFRLPLYKMAYITYNMAKQGVYEPDVVKEIERNAVFSSSTEMSTRSALGGLYAWYYTN